MQIKRRPKRGSAGEQQRPRRPGEGRREPRRGWGGGSWVFGGAEPWPRTLARVSAARRPACLSRREEAQGGKAAGSAPPRPSRLVEALLFGLDPGADPAQGSVPSAQVRSELHLAGGRRALPRFTLRN